MHCSDPTGIIEFFALVFGAIGLTLGYFVWGKKA